MDPNSQIELELVPMASDENLNNIQDDVNANFKQVRTSFRSYSDVGHIVVIVFEQEIFKKL